MKANAPEKLYVDTEDRLSDSILYGFIKKHKDNDIEYIKKDAFIEKACNWLEQTLSPYIPYCDIDIDLAIENFKKYMEGE